MRGCAEAVGTLQCKRYVIEPVEQTVLARWGEVEARCRVARRRQGLRLKVDRGLEAWRCCGLFCCNVSKCQPNLFGRCIITGQVPARLDDLAQSGFQSSIESVSGLQPRQNVREKLFKS